MSSQLAQLSSETTRSRKLNLTTQSQLARMHYTPIMKPECYDKEVMTDDVQDYQSQGEGYDSTSALSSSPMHPPRGRRMNHGKATSTSTAMSNLTKSSIADASAASTEALNKATAIVKQGQATAAPATVAAVIDFQAISQREDFLQFFSSSTRTLERALSAAASVDILADYRLGKDDKAAGRRGFDDSCLLLHGSLDAALVKGIFHQLLSLFCESSRDDQLQGDQSWISRHPPAIQNLSLSHMALV
jgi:hypothetical protein